MYTFFATVAARRATRAAFAAGAVWGTALLAGCAAGPETRVAGAGPAAPALRGLEDRGEYVAAGIPPIRPEVRERMLQYLNVRSASLVDLHDAPGAPPEILIQTRFGNAAQLHRVARPGGDRTQLTFYDEPVAAAACVPHSGGRRLVLLRDVGGSEDWQVFHLDLAAGKTTRLTSGKGQNGNLAVSRDGRLLAFRSTERNGRDYDICLADLTAEMTPRCVYQGTGANHPIEFSPDGQQLLFQRYVSNKESHLLRLDVASGDAKPVTPPDESAVHENGVFSADGRAVFYTSDHEGEFLVLYKRDLATGREEAVSRNLPWDVEGVAASSAGNAVVFFTNEDGISRAYRLEPPDSLNYVPLALPGEGVVSNAQFNRAGTHLGFTLGTASAPGDVYVMPVARFADGAAAAERWTHSEVGGLDPQQFVTPTHFAYPTFDDAGGRRRMIPAYYFRPRGAGPFPVVISLHGGPEAQYRPAFSGLWQYLVNELGIAVIAPNVRGSTGYGRSYHTLDDAMHREDAVADVGQLLAWIALQKELDPHRVCVFGGSYGGYMVLASLTHFPDRIRAGIDVVGIANFVSFLERTRDYRRDLRRREYGDEQDPAMREYLTRISPLTSARNIRSALFVLHGQNDPRVPLFEAEQIVRHLQDARRPVWFYMAKGEGHGFRKRSNSDAAQVLYAMFLEEHLLRR